jgi:isopenicillin-N epimerase
VREQFLINPEVVFLNHGSFGACPKPVFETYQRWQLELERQPVEFLARRHDTLMGEARTKLAAYLNADPANLIYVVNATTGVNLVARSLKLKEGDEILGTDHEYGACELTWDFVCERTGAKYIHHAIPIPVTSAEELVESFWAQVTPRTKMIYLSHITSPTALIFPIAEICRRAREAGILTLIDGAHAPGQISLDLTALDADFYTGNCHKWLCAPKGSGFLYAQPQHHAWLEPTIISWGWQEDGTFASRHQMQATRDIAAFLSVPAAIEFQQAHDWDSVWARCHELVRYARQRITDLTGLTSISPDSTDWFVQMATFPLPDCNPEDLKRRLYDEFRVEIPIVTWNNRYFVRVSIQAYNTQDDVDYLVEALRQLLAVNRSSVAAS